MKITDNKQYKESLHKVFSLMNKGESNLTDTEAREIEVISKAIEYYEDYILKLMPMPVTINAIVQKKAEEMDISQKQLADMFGMTAPKLSQILNGKRQPDISFLKAVHQKLGIDGNFILEMV